MVQGVIDMRRKYTPLHNKWHRRVEGQIKNTINCHPNWFNFKNPIDRNNCINSLAKRIVGEIIADLEIGNNKSLNVPKMFKGFLRRMFSRSNTFGGR